MVAALLLVLVVLALGGGVVVMADRCRQAPALETVELRFAPDVKEDAVWGVLGTLSGLPTSTQVVLEVVGDGDGIRHFLRAERTTIDVLRSHFRGLLPGVRLEPVEPDELPAWRATARVRWGGRHPLLLDSRSPEAAAALLGALSGLRDGEQVRVCWSLRPATPALPRGARVRLPAMRRARRHRIWPSHLAE